MSLSFRCCLRGRALGNTLPQCLLLLNILVSAQWRPKYSNFDDSFNSASRGNLLFSTNCHIKSRRRVNFQWAPDSRVQKMALNQVIHVCIFTHIIVNRCMCTQPAVNAVLWYRFHAAHCLQCSAVNISWAENKQSAAEIQQQFVFVTRKQRGFPIGQNVHMLWVKTDKREKRNSLNWQWEVKSVQTCSQRGTET